MSVLLENALAMVEYFSDVATADPLSAVLLASGALLTGVAVTAFGGLAVGGLLAPLVTGR